MNMQKTKLLAEQGTIDGCAAMMGARCHDRLTAGSGTGDRDPLSKQPSAAGPRLFSEARDADAEAGLHDDQRHEHEQVAPKRPLLRAPQPFGLLAGTEDRSVHQDGKGSARWLHADAADEPVVDEMEHELDEPEVTEVEMLRQREIKRGPDAKASSGGAGANASSSSADLDQVPVKGKGAARPSVVSHGDDLVIVDTKLTSRLDSSVVETRERASAISVGPESLGQLLRAVRDAESSEGRARIHGPDAGRHLGAHLS